MTIPVMPRPTGAVPVRPRRRSPWVLALTVTTAVVVLALTAGGIALMLQGGRGPGQVAAAPSTSSASSPGPAISTADITDFEGKRVCDKLRQAEKDGKLSDPDALADVAFIVGAGSKGSTDLDLRIIGQLFQDAAELYRDSRDISSPETPHYAASLVKSAGEFHSRCVRLGLWG